MSRVTVQPQPTTPGPNLRSDERDALNAPSSAKPSLVKTRTVEIDGIRGWASVSVLLFHVLSEMLGTLVPALRSHWLHPLLNGELAVAIFFVLSGDALSSPFFQSEKATDVDRLVLKRYPRLTVSITLSCVFVFALLEAGLDFHRAAAVIAHREEWLGSMLNLVPSAQGLLKYCLLGVYTSHSGQTSYNPFLWTMSIELVGSMIVFLACYLWERLRWPVQTITGACIALLLLNSDYSLFFAGMIFGYLRKTGFLERVKAKSGWQLGGWLAVTAVYGLLAVLTAPRLPYLNQLAAIILVFSFYTNRTFIAFFQSRLSRWFGDLSFPIYLVQFPVIISLMSWLLVSASSTGGREISHLQLGAIAVATLGVVMAASMLFRAIEDRILRSVNRRTVSLLFRGIESR